ncbi:hypothetical protein CGRA01v4_11040 [Colletotrichum graminicola]|nr:hypothetical protein CGRA01v4_11040 [Colletotrichum graminicola]
MGIWPSAYPDVVLLQPRNAADRRHLTMHEICNAPLRCVTKPKLVASDPQRQRYNLSSCVSGLDRFNIGPSWSRLSRPFTLHRRQPPLLSPLAHPSPPRP